jgi:hypothetical protein
MVMQPYKGYFIDGSAMPVHPFNPDWYVGGSVLVSGRSSLIVEITRFQLQRFTVSIKELAEWFGIEVARLVVEECPHVTFTSCHSLKPTCFTYFLGYPNGSE